MPRTSVLLYRDHDGSVPLLDWFDTIPDKAMDKCRIKIERLRELGHELRRPEADYLREGIYELRIGYRGVNYRMVYFFHDRAAAILTHGLTKERLVPPAEIDLAVRRRQAFERDPARHTATVEDQ